MANEQPCPLRESLGFWLRRVTSHLELALAATLKAHDVTVIEWMLLRDLFESEAVSLRGIARRLELSLGAVSKIVARLERRGLVDRFVTDLGIDTREHVIVLSEQGSDLVDVLTELWVANEREFFGHLPEANQAHYLGALRAILVRRKVDLDPAT
jgi:DNA-binding MarR family transcriptional regulator